MKTRCKWPNTDLLMISYHDKEWGVPIFNDRKIFEFLVLESAQAGLSWRTILYRREGYKKAFANFDYRKVAKFTKRDVMRLLKDARIIRNRLKIEATVNNAQKFLEVQKEFGSFAKYMWSFVGSQQIDGKRKTLKDLPAITPEAEIFAKDLKLRGFKFLGPTIVYAHMQAVGMVNDHTQDCFRYKEIKRKGL
ncbi:MAG: DNA-3-methyladenine glycosylase [Candidatus Zambryskibacteria bacterium RIFCSPLOWO2_01_FULL_43_17]|uniref:DNA-3-methyladenine glycosylase n=1 Tax=Candidatus Zambryskibacteria bacterium RIFCSPLOWO2_01_FULL_43_17 TaxID=1802760 RepID=A0A1G2U6Q5_9BACT|nr:MAG: DNA-3-methyladenine glycosylase [Candidatus Zambryskibacteria bacterium RIFCSPLOWO2_01_FULL_43_17]